jgi:hypothetical protein
MDLRAVYFVDNSRTQRNPKPWLRVSRTLFHVVHGAGFGDDGFAGIGFHFDDLHVVAENLIIDFMALHGVSPFAHYCRLGNRTGGERYVHVLRFESSRYCSWLSACSCARKVEPVWLDLL